VTYDPKLLHGLSCPYCGAFEQAEAVMFSNKKHWVWIFCKKCLKFWRREF
jgi:hypothetical protein